MKTTDNTLFDECNANTADITLQLVTEAQLMLGHLNVPQARMTTCLAMMAAHRTTADMLRAMLPLN